MKNTPVQHRCLYAISGPALSLAEIERLAMEGATCTEAGGSVIVEWPGIKVTVTAAIPDDELAEHLRGFQGFVWQMSGGGEWTRSILDFIAEVRTVVGCRIDAPAGSLQADSLILSMACSYENCMIFANDMIYSELGDVVFGPEEAPPLADISQLVVRRVRMDEVIQTSAQSERQARVQGQLDQFKVPVFARPLRWMPDDSVVQLRSPQQIHQRVVALHGVIGYARHLTRNKSVPHVSPEEAAFLENPNPEWAQELIWRLEALLVLLWSLGEVAELPWPGSMCDVEAVHELAQRVSNSAGEFRPRDVVTILDELERTSRLNWALRHAHQHGQTVPVDLDWNGSSVFVAVSDCPLVGVVQQRHHTLNWLVRFQDAEWDEVDTPA